MNKVVTLSALVAKGGASAIASAIADAVDLLSAQLVESRAGKSILGSKSILLAQVRCPDGKTRMIRLNDRQKRYVIVCDESQLPRGGDTDVTLSYEWIKDSGQ